MFYLMRLWSLLKKLRSPSAAQRRVAVEALGQLGDARAVEPIIALLDDPDDMLRMTVANVLGQFSDQRAVQPLVASLQDRNDTVRVRAALALAKFEDPRAAEPLFAALQGKSKSLSIGEIKAIMEALQTLGLAAFDLLIPKLQCADENVRRTAAAALGKLGDDRAVEPLLVVLRDAHAEVRKAAALALVSLRWKPSNGLRRVHFAIAKGDWDACVQEGVIAVNLLISIIQDADNDDWKVREAACSSLVRIGSPAVEPLIAVLRDSDKRGRFFAARTLGQLGDFRAVEPLIAALAEADARVVAADALGQLGDIRAVEPLISTLRDLQAGSFVAKALVQLGSPAVGPLIMALKDAERVVREAATVALGQLGDIRAVEPLIVVLQDADSEVRKSASEALNSLGWKPADALSRVHFAIAEGTVMACLQEGTVAFDPLIIALRDRDHKVRRAAVEALGQLGDTRAVEPLIMALKDAERVVREAAAVALGQLGDIHAVEPLIIALKDWDHTVPWAVEKALGQLLDVRAIEPLRKQLFQASQSRDRLRVTVNALTSLIQWNISIIPSAQLQTIVETPDPTGYESKCYKYYAGMDEDEYVNKWVPVGTIDLSTLRHLARQELNRRQA